MKNRQLTLGIGGVALTGLGVLMIFTNPGRQTYEEYAAERLNVYLKENVCTQVPQKLGDFLERQCRVLVDTARPQLKRLIFENTEQQNFLFFSIYRTDLNAPSPLPDYHFETLGIFNNLYVYQAEEI